MAARWRVLLNWWPGVAVAGYLAITSGLYLSMSVSDLGTPRLGLTAIFTAGVVVAVLIGYAIGVRGGRPGFEPQVERATGTRAGMSQLPPLHLLLVLAAALWWLLFGVASMANRGIGGPAELLARVADPRSSYYAKFDELAAGVSPLLQVLTLTGLLYWLLIPMTVLYWRRMPLWLRGAALAGVVSYALLFLGTGTQKGVVDICLQAGVAIFAVSLARGRLGVRHMVGAGLLVAVGLCVVITSLGQRTDATSSIMQEPGNTEQAALLEPVVGETAARGTIVLRDYVTHGYRGLGYSLDLPFEWTYGVGSMRSLSSYLPQYLGIDDPYARSYPVRVEEAVGWSATEKWTTIYPWLASDVTFPGVVVLFGLLGWTLARAWRAFLDAEDVWALVGLVVLSVLFVFAPANNQLFNDRYSALGVITLLLVVLARTLRPRVAVLQELHRFVVRAAAYLVRTAARWRARAWLELLNRVSRRPAVSSRGTATVSVTTYAGRLPGVHVALESIARGADRPARLVLWVDAEVVEEARASAQLRRLVRRGLEIRAADSSLGPHKKHVHPVEGLDLAADEQVLVIADDDIVYPREWLSELVARFEALGRRSVVSWWVKKYRFDDNGLDLAPYRSWTAVRDTEVRRDGYLMGGSGTAFPAAVVDELRRRGREFLETTPRADDIWLNVVALRTGVGVAQVRPDPLVILTVPMTQRSKLSSENVTGQQNDIQLRATFRSDDLAELRGAAGVGR